MTVLRAQVSLQRDTLLPEDAVINTWHFRNSPGQSGQVVWDSISSQLNTFYQAIDGLLSESLTGAATLRVYDLTDPEPRVPRATYTLGLTVSAGASLPNEIALCLSYRATSISGSNAARRRGRIYLGPWGVANQTVVAGDTRPTSGLMSTIATAASALANPLAVKQADWVVFSPTTAGPAPWTETELDAASLIVTDGWVDNAWDIQRSRGIEPSLRTTWT